RPSRQRVHEEHQAAGDRRYAGEVEVPVTEVWPALAQDERSEQCRTHADWDVDEEDPRPAQVAREDAAEEDAGGGAASRRRAVDAERAVALASLRERRHQQGERGRREQRAAEALQRAKTDERAFRPGDAAEQ